MMNRLFLMLTTLGVLAVTGCTSVKPLSIDNVSLERESFVIAAAYNAVDSLIANQTISPIIQPSSNRGVLVATIADLNNLDRSNSLGRLLSEQMSSRLAQMGVGVKELKLRGNLFVSKAEGEFLLSREVKEISDSQNAELVLVGTYVDAGSAIYVTVKLVRASDSRVSSAYNFAIAKTGAVTGLLR